MSAHSLPLNLHKALENEFFHIDDPGASGTFVLDGKGHGICEVVTGGAESRTVPAVGGVEVGMRLTIIFKTDGGNLTISGTDQTLVLTDAGSFVTLVVVDNNGTKAWRVAEDSRVEGADTVQLSALGLGSKTVDIPIGNNWRVWDALETNLAAADGTDDLGLVTGTYLTSSPTFNVTAATPSADPFYAREPGFVVPWNYDAGTNLTLDITVTEAVAATTATVDANVVRRAAPSTDIVATAAQSVVGAAGTVYSFTITGTNVVPGEVLDIRIFLTLDDGAATPNYSINKVNVDYTAGNS